MILKYLFHFKSKVPFTFIPMQMIESWLADFQN